MSSEIHEHLSVALNWEHPVEQRVEATMRLAELGDPQVVIPLGAMLGETEGPLADAAGEALERLSALSVLLSELESSDDEVRVRAAQILTILRNPSSLEALQRAMKDPHPKVREEAATALYELRAPESLDVLVEALFSDPDPDVRGAAAQALGELKLPEAFEALERAEGMEQDEFTLILIERSINRHIDRRHD